MEEISTVGIDLAKSVFQIHAIDAGGVVIVRRQLRRQQMMKFFVSIGVVTGPLIGSQKGPLPLVASGQRA